MQNAAQDLGLQRIGRYEVLALLATGGMAEVFLGRLQGAVGFQRAVVIKRMLPHLARDEEFRTMFVDEARIVSRLSHPNIVHVHELIAEDDELYLVMEYLDGETLSELLRTLRKRGERLPLHVTCHILGRVAAGLHHAHELRDSSGQLMNLVHRDVSPQNVFVGYDGTVKLIDFGIAKARDRATHTSTGMIKGKFSYMSPEQIRTEEVDRRADLFSVGVLFHEMVAGERLFTGNQLEIAQRIALEDVPRLDLEDASVPAEIADIVERALSKEPEERQPDAQQLQTEIASAAAALFSDAGLAERELAELMATHFAQTKVRKRQILVDAKTEIEAEVRTPTEPMVRERSRRPAFVAAAVVLGLALVAGVVLAVQQDEDAPRVTATRPVPDPSTSTSTSTSTSPSPAPVAIDEPEARRVRLEISTRPLGAEVLVAGRPRGETPLVLELDHGEEAVEIVARAEGHADYRAQLVPDVDQRVDWALQRVSTRRRRRPPRMQPDMSPPDMRPDDFFRVN